MSTGLERPPTRSQLTRALAANAATKPVNVVAGAGVAVAAAVLGTVWLWPVAVIVYLAMVIATFFDASEAERLGERRRARPELGAARALDPKRFAGPIAEPLAAAINEERQIRHAIEGSDLPFREVSGEVDALVASLGQSAQRAQVVYDYLASQDFEALERRLTEMRSAGRDPERARTAVAMEEQLRLGRDLEQTLERYLAQLEHAAVSLATIRGQLVQISVAGDADRQADAAERVRSLRDELGAVVDGMREAYARAGAEG
jgi:hypothetical protein